jgi:hypothetical protein
MNEKKAYNDTEEIYAHLQSYFDLKKYEEASIASALISFLLDHYVQTTQDLPFFLETFADCVNCWIRLQEDVE